MNLHHGLWLLLGLMTLVAVGCVVAAMVSLVRVLRLRVRGVEATATVVDLTPQEDGGFAPVVEYVVSGRAHRVESNRAYNREEHPLGSAMRVLYAPDDPGTARVLGTLDFYGPALALTISASLAGAVAAGLAYLLLYAT